MDNLARTENNDVEAQTPVQETPKPLKVVKAEKVKNRPVNELHNVNPRSMTDPERVNYINTLRAEVNDIAVKNQMLEHNCDLAYERVRQAEQKYTDYRTKALAKLQFAKQAVSTCHNSIIIMGNMEE